MRIEMLKLLLCERKASARSRVGCVRVAAAVQASSALPLLLSLLLLGSNSRGKGDQCRSMRVCWSRSATPDKE